MPESASFGVEIRRIVKCEAMEGTKKRIENKEEEGQGIELHEIPDSQGLGMFRVSKLATGVPTRLPTEWKSTVKG